jgi:hypothetical protein
MSGVECLSVYVYVCTYMYTYMYMCTHKDRKMEVLYEDYSLDDCGCMCMYVHKYTCVYLFKVRVTARDVQDDQMQVAYKKHTHEYTNVVNEYISALMDLYIRRQYVYVYVVHVYTYMLVQKWSNGSCIHAEHSFIRRSAEHVYLYI